MGFSTAKLNDDLYVGDLFINALNANTDRPFIHMDSGEVLTVGDVRDLTSQYTQALQCLEIGKETKIGVLSTNKPEVLVLTSAANIMGACLVPLHPMGSVDDFAYAFEDAGIEVELDTHP